MVFLMQALFIIGIFMMPVVLFIALPLILLPLNNELFVLLRELAIVASILGGPVLLGLCTMNYQFTVPHIDVSEFLPEKKEQFTRYALILEKAMTVANQGYEAYWTTENRIVLACFACIVTGFGLDQAPASSLNTAEVAMLKLGGIASTIITITSITIHFRLRKASN